MRGPKFVLLGSLTMDNTFTSEGVVTPQVYGGNVVYSALGARIWHDRVGMVSRAGINFPEAFLRQLKALGIEVEGVIRVDAPHGMNVAFCYRPDGSRSRAFPPEVMARIPGRERPRFIDYTTISVEHRFRTWLDFAPGPEDFPASWRPGAAGVHLAAMPVEKHLALTASLRNEGASLHIQVDSPWYDERDLTRDYHTELFGRTDILLPSEADLASHMPGLDPVDAGRRLQRWGAAMVVIKQGGAGCTILDGRSGRTVHVPSYPAAVVDLTGAGDAFCGGFLVGWVETGDLLRAAAMGTVSASFAIEGVGPLPLFHVARGEAERRLNHLLDRLSSTLS